MAAGGDENQLDSCEVGIDLPMDGNVNPSPRTATQVQTARKKDSIAISITLDPDDRSTAGGWALGENRVSLKPPFSIIHQWTTTSPKHETG